MNNNNYKKIPYELLQKLLDDVDGNFEICIENYNPYLNAVCINHAMKIKVNDGYMDEDLKQFLLLSIYTATKKFHF